MGRSYFCFPTLQIEKIGRTDRTLEWSDSLSFPRALYVVVTQATAAVDANMVRCY